MMGTVGRVVLVVCVSILLPNLGSGELQVPCYFIFGDSLSDAGNNNNLPTFSKSNFPPYGIDYTDQVATGRFSNGRTSVDLIGRLLGFEKDILSFAAARGLEILRGVNYASGAAGIRNETGDHLGFRISMNGQIEHYEKTLAKLIHIFGDSEAATYKYLSKCIYYVGLGSNDYGNNYYLPEDYPTYYEYNSTDDFAAALLQEYSQQIQTLYKYGARKVVLPGINPLGCYPSALSLNNGSCIDYVNDAAIYFNDGLKSLVVDLNTNLTDAQFIYVDSYGIFEDILTNSSYGITVTDSSCCTVQTDLYLCTPLKQPCSNRSEHLFWDDVHLTETANSIIAGRAYVAQNSSDAYPFGIRSLAQLSLSHINNAYDMVLLQSS